MLANIPKDTKSFLTWLLQWCQTLQIIRKNFPERISPQPQERGAILVTVTKKPVPRPSTTSFAFSEANLFFFSAS